jgi:hypothetical protein
MRVFVAGATGAIGRPLVAGLVQQGHEVTASTRNPSKAEQLRARGVTPVILDGLDAAAVTEAITSARPEVIIHQMTALAGKPDVRHFDRWFAATNTLRTRGSADKTRPGRRCRLREDLPAQPSTAERDLGYRFVDRSRRAAGRDLLLSSRRRQRCQHCHRLGSHRGAWWWPARRYFGVPAGSYRRSRRPQTSSHQPLPRSGPGRRR